jgi:hypothetical protein
MNRFAALSARIKKTWRILGPGLITGASDDDPSGIATYSQAGAGFGLATLWTALITFPLMAVVQEMCARIGMVTEEGLTATLRKKYPKGILYLMAVVSFPAITLNIGEPLPIYCSPVFRHLLSAQCLRACSFSALFSFNTGGLLAYSNGFAFHCCYMSWFRSSCTRIGWM